jgi:hypothetical protein
MSAVSLHATLKIEKVVALKQQLFLHYNECYLLFNNNTFVCYFVLIVNPNKIETLLQRVDIDH